MIRAKHGARVPLNIRVTVNSPDRIEQLVQQARAEIDQMAERALESIYPEYYLTLRQQQVGRVQRVITDKNGMVGIARDWTVNGQPVVGATVVSGPPL